MYRVKALKRNIFAHHKTLAKFNLIVFKSPNFSLFPSKILRALKKELKRYAVLFAFKTILKFHLTQCRTKGYLKSVKLPWIIMHLEVPKSINFKHAYSDLIIQFSTTFVRILSFLTQTNTCSL